MTVNSYQDHQHLFRNPFAPSSRPVCAPKACRFLRQEAWRQGGPVDSHRGRDGARGARPAARALQGRGGLPLRLARPAGMRQAARGSTSTWPTRVSSRSSAGRQVPLSRPRRTCTVRMANCSESRGGGGREGAATSHFLWGRVGPELRRALRPKWRRLGSNPIWKINHVGNQIIPPGGLPTPPQTPRPGASGASSRSPPPPGKSGIKLLLGTQFHRLPTHCVRLVGVGPCNTFELFAAPGVALWPWAWAATRASEPEPQK